MEPLEVLAVVASVAMPIGALALQRQVVRLNRQAQRSQWDRTFTELHKEFWTDSDYAVVREWLANDRAYADLRAVLDRRLNEGPELEATEYLMVERLDKFLNFLLRAYAVAARLGGTREMWRPLYFQYWVDQCRAERRPLVFTYIDRFYAKTFYPLFNNKWSPNDSFFGGRYQYEDLSLLERLEDALVERVAGASQDAKSRRS